MGGGTNGGSGGDVGWLGSDGGLGGALGGAMGGSFCSRPDGNHRSACGSARWRSWPKTMMATVKTTSEIIKPRVDVVLPLIFAYHFCRNLHLVGSEDSIADAGASPEK